MALQEKDRDQEQAVFRLLIPLFLKEGQKISKNYRQVVRIEASESIFIDRGEKSEKEGEKSIGLPQASSKQE